MTEYLTTADALFFHKQLIARHGGAPGVRDLGALESALHRPQTGYYQTIVEEAAALMESVAKNHPFVDGNKRVAFAVTHVFLRINGYELMAKPLEVHKHMINLFEEGTFDMAHLVPWLQTIVSKQP